MPKQRSYKKFVRKMLMKLTTALPNFVELECLFNVENVLDLDYFQKTKSIILCYEEKKLLHDCYQDIIIGRKGVSE